MYIYLIKFLPKYKDKLLQTRLWIVSSKALDLKDEINVSLNLWI